MSCWRKALCHHGLPIGTVSSVCEAWKEAMHARLATWHDGVDKAERKDLVCQLLFGVEAATHSTRLFIIAHCGCLGPYGLSSESGTIS